MELEKLEVIIEANMAQFEKELDRIKSKASNFFNQLENLSSKTGNSLEKNMDISKGQKKMLDQLKEINQSIKEMPVNADKSSKGTGEKIGSNISNGLKKSRTQVNKDLNGIVNDIQDKMKVASALRNKITSLRGQREEFQANGNTDKIADVDLKIAKAQQQMNKMRSSARATAGAMKREFDSIPDSLKAIENEMVVNESKIESMRKKIASLNAQRNAQKTPIGNFSDGFKYVDNDKSLKTAESIRKQSEAMEKLIAKNNALQQAYASTEDRAKELRKSLDLLKNKFLQQGAQSSIAKPMANKATPKTPMRAIPKFGGVSGRTSNAIAHGWSRLPNLFKSAGNALKAFGRLHKKVTNSVGGDYRAMNSSFAAWRLSLRFLLPSLVIYNLLGAAIRNLASGLVSALNTNAQFAASLNQIKVNLLTAFYPIYTAILPAINALMSALARLTGLFASFISMLFGKTFAQSKAGAQGLYSNVKALDATGSSAKKANKQAKELQRTLMGFDQINKLDAKTDKPDADGGGGGGADTPTLDFNTPNYPVPDWMKYFKPILDAWNTTGQKVMDAWKYALGEIQRLLKSIGKSFSEVWNNGSGQALFEQIFLLLANILNIIGDIAKAFRIAWDDGGRGTALIQSVFDMLTNILSLLNAIAESFRNAFNDGLGVAIAANLLEIFTDIFNTVGTLADKLREAWEVNGNGEQIFRSILTIINDILTHINGVTKATEEWAESLDFTPLLNSINTLLQSLVPLSDNIGAGLEWFYTNVLLPLSKFTIEKIIPDFIDILSSALEVLNNVIDALKPLAQWLWDEFLQPLASWTGGTVDKVLKAIADALKSIGEFVEKHQTAIETMAIVLGSFAAAYWLVNAALTAWNIIAGIATAVTTGLATVIAILTSPVTLVIAAIGALIAIGVLLWKNWDTISAKAKEIWEALKEWFDQTCQAIGKFFSDLWQGIKNVFSGVGNWFKEKFDTAYKNIQNAFSAIGQWFGQQYNNIKNVFRAVGTWFGNKFDEAYNGVVSAFNGIVGFFGGIWDSIKNTFSYVGTMVGDAIGGGVKSVINGVLSIVEDTINNGIDLLNGAVDLINMIPGVNIGGFSYLNLPRLAQGGYVKANKPQLAMIGDNTKYGEIVAPENKMLEMARKAAELTNKKGNNDPRIVSFLDAILSAIDNLGSALNNAVRDSATNGKLTMPEVFERYTQTPVVSSTNYNGGGMQQLSDNLLNQLMSMATNNQANNGNSGDIVINIGGKEFGRIAVSEINKYHEQLGYSELNV